MKKLFFVVLIFSLLTVGCSDATRSYIEPDKIDHNEEVETNYFEGKIVEVKENSILVEPIDASTASKSSDRIDVSIDSISVDFDLSIGDIVGITYTGGIAESYPAQIIGTVAINHINDDLKVYIKKYIPLQSLCLRVLLSFVKTMKKNQKKQKSYRIL